MTKSLGRTYSLLNFSGREMHYWTGNLPRRRVCVMSLGVSCTCDVIAMLHPLVLVFRKRTQPRATPLALFISLPSLLLHPSRSPAVESLRLRCSRRSGREPVRGHGRTCVKSPGVCCFCRRQCLCHRVRVQEILTARFVHEGILLRNRGEKLNMQ